MTPLQLRLRNLWYFRAVNIAAAAGIAVATTVLSGALMVGDSVRGSLSELANQRLGKIDQAIMGPFFFDQSLADRLAKDSTLSGKFEFNPAIIEHGSAANESGDIKTSGVQIIGEGANWVNVARNDCVLNSQTADSLEIHSGGNAVALAVPTESDMPRDATLSHRAREDTISGLRLNVARVVSEPGMAELFTPAGGQRTPRNAWVNLADLQEAVDQRGRVNTLFVHDDVSQSDATDKLNSALAKVLTVDDYGLKLSPTADGKEAMLTSRRIYLSPAVEKAAEATGIPLRKISVNLVNAVYAWNSHHTDLGQIHYAVAAGISPLENVPLGDKEAAVNQWTADQLHVKVGDYLRFTYYVRASDGSLIEAGNATTGPLEGFRIVRILPMSGIGADASLTPTYKGLTDAASIADWNPPAGVVIDQRLVTKADEAYWKKYKAAPKIFLNYEDAHRLWGQELGDLTSLRVPADRAEEFGKKLLSQLDPASMGMAFRPLRDQQLAAANGSVDFGQLFVAFSFFLIAAAILLVAMLFRLAVEQRARQLGVLAAIGFSGRTLRKVVMGEQMLVSLVGGLVGTAGAVGYTWLLMAGLRTWWVGAVGTTALKLFAEPNTLFTGFVYGQLAALFATAWALWHVAHAGPARLLGGSWDSDFATKRKTGRLGKFVAVLCFFGGIIMVESGLTGRMPPQTAFLYGGTLLLVSCLCWTSVRLRKDQRNKNAAASLARLGLRNAKRHPSRSVLCIGLVAAAAFTLVTIAAMKQPEPTDTGDIHSGSGGYRLMLETDIPLLGNPGTAMGRELLGFRNPTDAIWDRVKFLPMRRCAGQDVSCLNLTQPTNPVILGVPDELIERNGFSFAAADNVKNPWTLLQQARLNGNVPMFADDSTAQYILHLAPGQTLDAGGAKLELSATLAGSIFQSEVLISEDNFRKLFPAQSGFNVVLVDVSPADLDQVRHLLSEELSDFGVRVETTSSVLAGYLQVQNTYLSTFQMLGALGLMLGTIGLAVVLVRTVIERKAELALLASLGFGTGKRLRLILAENVFLLTAGLATGTICAFLGVLPALRQSARSINFYSIAATLVGALVCGLLSSGLAAFIVGKDFVTADLRRE